MTPQQIGHWIGVLLGGFAGGAICGVPLLLLGLKKNRRGFALGSWVGCTVAGLVWGLVLAIPVSVVLTVVILCPKRREELNSAKADAESGRPD
jgi:energy-converting hydrogenase Eha subunit G